ncbi:MAG: methyltransferase domain-containing protein [Gammaproteobacteria bacterium]|nr:methyltransferase domain-containing protein [Gammaproteobacteria bacterium]
MIGQDDGKVSTRYSERDAETYYDKEDSTYRAFWDSEGSLHWGYFDHSTGDDFLAASANWNLLMLSRSGIDANSLVLDLGCGNGNTPVWLTKQRSCHVTGVDLSGVRVRNARETASKLAPDVASRLVFEKASATDLPFPDGAFTHVWSQATIYHVPDKHKVLAEVFRVLRAGGTFIFDDLTKPKSEVSAQARKYVYDRLLFDTPFSFDGYQAALKAQGFEVAEAEDLSAHLATSYKKLGELASAATARGDGDFSGLTEAYRHMIAAVDARELGWASYVCRK